MSLSNDTKGWIMTCVSGIACVLGSSIICIDPIVRLFPGKRNFSIQDSSAFLSASLSLSAGVMLFSALYSMLPSSSESFKNGGLSPQAAAWALIACFLGGVVGIQIVSKLLHHFIPSHVIDCDDTHQQDGHTEEHKDDDQARHEEPDVNDNHADSQEHTRAINREPIARSASETTPLITFPQGSSKHLVPNGGHDTQSRPLPTRNQTENMPRTSPSTVNQHRPTLQARLTSRIASLVRGETTSCPVRADGKCYGYSNPCAEEGFKIIQSRIPESSHESDSTISREHPLLRRSTTQLAPSNANSLSHDSISSVAHAKHQGVATGLAGSPAGSQVSLGQYSERDGDLGDTDRDIERGRQTESLATETQGTSHHHHVPKNAFLSLGLQTSIAIALHKMPEGFITFATNHANPTLGFAVFMALFIHNISEGFALALPLYLALDSRWKAMLWSSLLGGLSQPFGAFIAAMWFKVAGRGDMAPGEGIYGAMFAITSGIMTSVALQLFSESLGLSTNRSLCIAFAFVGMGILGFSFALTAG
ncbi:MAG: hypothetical protein M1837_006221 [Sclerophora amabilis]|nr:MAG: hypothetical protein M1837_006221 [Sclerophora amabilis]